MMTPPSARPAVIGVDTGMSACKAVLVADGRQIMAFTAGYPTRREVDGSVTQRAGDWLRAVQRVLRECAAAAASTNLTVEALGFTAPAHAAVLLDSAGDPLAPVLLYADGRPAATAAALRDQLGSEYFATTFVALTEGWTFPQLVWIRHEWPEVWRRVRQVLPQKDFLRFSLTGTAATDPSDAAGMALLDQRIGTWSDWLGREAALDPAWLPPIQPATAIGGALTAGWARRTGLKAGTPVVVGATDTAVELLAAGVTAPGRSLVKIASTGTVVTVTDRPRPDPRLLTYPHALPDRWYTVAATSNAATSYAWLARLLGVAENRPDRVLDPIARRVPAGSDGLLFLPFLDGERSPYWDRDQRGAFLGLTGAHGPGHLARAILEGVAFSLRDCRDLMTAELGLPVEAPIFSGGGVQSPLWRKILASVLDQTGARSDPSGPAIGVALLAARAAGYRFHQLDWRPIGARRQPVEPDPAWADVYDRRYPVYRAAVPATVGVSHALARSDSSR